MKKIEAYKCNFCKKVYENRSSCKSHEYKCYYNPKTQSCAGCAFLLRSSIEISKARFYEFSACLVNHNVIGNLRTKCQDFANKNNRKEVLKANQLRYELFDTDKANENARSYCRERKMQKP